MKRIQIILIIKILFLGVAFAQDSIRTAPANIPTMKRVYVNKEISTHFLSPEPIQYVDISTHSVEGDLPVPNILRIKPVADSIINNSDLGVVTIVGQKFMTQFKIEYTPFMDKATTQVDLMPDELKSFDHPEFTLSDNDMNRYALDILRKKPSYHNVKTSAFDMNAYLNNIYTVGDYFFVDVTFYNKTNIQYSIDQIRFKIEDKKITKATNVQEVEIKSVYDLQKATSFKKKYRNVFVFKKFTFPGDKVFTIELAENQISGRVIYLQVDYKDVLKADTL
jgi:conjugative transposon TraN protein